ncbi:hypothetical protein [Megasphaera sp. An286]|jgi:hypothetical protein|uniref:hypothetical protein n=1 Tax=Megasphaera sp. An286 TaxID=1965622 RepID=UPI00117F65D3|nr:hypothetical protein [Megasphaera sp. An286]
MKRKVVQMIRKTIVLCCLLTLGLSAMALAYVGNSHSMKFHSEGCRAEQKIRADHRVYLETREEAINAGYTPCGICKP